MATVTVSQKGWVVIPAEIRRSHNLKPGDRIRFVEYGGIISLIKEMKNPVEESFGILKRMGKGKRGSVTRALEREHAEERRRDNARYGPRR